MRYTRKIRNITLNILLLQLISCANTTVTKKNFDVNAAIENAVNKTRKTIEQLGDTVLYPRAVVNNSNQWSLVENNDWTSGFWPGILWYAYESTKDSLFCTKAEKYTWGIKDVLSIPVDNHDLGFMFYCSYGNGQRLINNEGYREILLQAADSLATLYNPVVGTILSWPSMVNKMNWPHNTIIDNMINLELLFWASKNGGSTQLYDIAVGHARVTMQNQIRPDYSTCHVAVYDTTDGHFIKGVTHQGFSDSSVWARGQAWGIYGFTMCYRETGIIEFLNTAVNMANLYIKRLPDDTVPYWDFDDPSIPRAPKDVSATAIVASALLELSGFVKDQHMANEYKQLAKKMLTNLSGNNYLAPNDNPAILLHSTGHRPNNSEIDVPIIYADYYYLEALLRLKKMNNE